MGVLVSRVPIFSVFVRQDSTIHTFSIASGSRIEPPSHQRLALGCAVSTFDTWVGASVADPLAALHLDEACTVVHERISTCVAELFVISERTGVFVFSHAHQLENIDNSQLCGARTLRLIIKTRGTKVLSPTNTAHHPVRAAYASG